MALADRPPVLVLVEGVPLGAPFGTVEGIVDCLKRFYKDPKSAFEKGVNRKLGLSSNDGQGWLTRPERDQKTRSNKAEALQSL